MLIVSSDEDKYSKDASYVVEKASPVYKEFDALHNLQNKRYKGGHVYISRIVKDLLSPEEVTAVAQAHRNMKDTFIGDPSIKAINERICSESSIVVAPSYSGLD